MSPYRLGYRDGFEDGRAAARPADDGGGARSAQQARDGDRPAEPPAPGQDGAATPIYKRPLLVLLVLALLLAALIGGIVWWRHSRAHEKTDDAFIDGSASTVASQTAGRVVRLLVNDNQGVRAGELLLEIDSRDNDARAAQARAQLADAQSQAEAARVQVEVRRAAALQAGAAVREALAESGRAERDAARYARVDPDAVARQQADAAAAALQGARAKLDAARSNAAAANAQTAAALAQVRTAQAGADAAKAALSAAELQASYARVFAPVDGRITQRKVALGNVVAAGQPLMSVVGEPLWVTANFKETQLTRMRIGMKVEVKVDAFPDAVFRAHIDSFQRGTGAYFSMLPAENATGNYVKVTQRVPVKIVFDDDELRRYPIGPGMSVTPDVAIP